MIPVARPKRPKGFLALELEVAAACPTAERERANFTLDALGLRRGAVAMRLREHYLHAYRRAVGHGMDAGEALKLLDEYAPQLAAYVRSTPTADTSAPAADTSTPTADRSLPDR